MADIDFADTGVVAATTDSTTPVHHERETDVKTQKT
jgi:hypothetical protein